MDLAIMIPLTDKAAKDAWLLPTDWDLAAMPTAGVRWPELGEGGRPRLPADIATHVQSEIADGADRYSRMFMITRSDIAILRVRRMLAEGAKFTATVYAVSDHGHERHEIRPNGTLASFPPGLFMESATEAAALARIWLGTANGVPPVSTTA